MKSSACVAVLISGLLAGCTNSASMGGDPAEHATCGCGSVDSNSPCAGNTINVTVKPTQQNTGSMRFTDATFKWRFSSSASDTYCGQFANGDYWIAPKTPGTAVTIASVTGNSGDNISVDDDPIMEETGILDNSDRYGNHAPANKLSFPVSYARATSLVAAKKRNERSDGHCGTSSIEGACVDAYNVVTVLPSVPPNAGSDMIRPNITGASKVYLRLSDFDFSRLPNSLILRGTDAAGWEKIRSRWSHSTEIFGLMTFDAGVGYTFSEGGRAFRAHIVLDDYGSGMAQAFNDDLLRVLSADNTFEEKRAAIAAMLSYGLDIYHDRYNPPSGYIRGWVSGAGQSNGKFLPTVFLAALMRDTTYADQLRTVGANAHAANEPDRGPAELRQIRLGAGSHTYIWGDDPSFANEEDAYWGAVLKAQCFDGASGAFGACDTTTGKRTQRDPYGYIDGPANLPGAGYMPITAGVQKTLVAIMYTMPEICSIINYPPLITYVDRVVANGSEADPDACAPPDPNEDPLVCTPFDNTGCTTYKVTWGPNGSGGCITGGSGRFTSKHHTALRLYYSSPQVDANWTVLRGSNPSCL